MKYTALVIFNDSLTGLLSGGYESNIIMNIFKVYTEFIERGSSASGPLDDRACFSCCAASAREIHQWRGFVVNAFVLSTSQGERDTSMRYHDCVTVICCAFLYHVTWRISLDFIGREQQGGSELRLKSNASSVVRKLRQSQSVIVVLRTCIVVCNYWISKTSLALLHLFCMAISWSISNRKSIGRKCLQPDVLHGKRTTDHSTHVFYGTAFECSVW